MVVVVVIGVPMWWKTTEVYRVSLPTNDILNLSKDPIYPTVKIGIFTFNVLRSSLLINELQEAFKNIDQLTNFWQITLIQIEPFAKVNTAHTPTALENLIHKEYMNVFGEGDFLFIEWPKLQEEVLMTTERSAFIKSDVSSVKLRNVINLMVLQTYRLQQMLTDDPRYTTKKEAPQAEYDVIVSVLNPRPDLSNVKWNVAMAVETYLRPFLDEVSQISNYTVKTQWRYQLAFETELKQVRDNTKLGRHFALPESALPHIITSIEKKLGVGIAAHKATINLVVYIPPCNMAPIHIYTNNNKLATRNKVDSFISPKWGGVIIANPPFADCVAFNEAPSQRAEFYVNTNDVMQIMLYQLHKLLDISVEVNLEGVKLVTLEQIAPRRWEYEAYIRRGAIMHIVTATNTLQSLIKLLDNISYIVINDEVGASIIDAYHNIVKAKYALNTNRLLLASERAKAAFVASEQAFFDASLLAQLYFPDEQKYAIYIPLFLPIMVPVITSLAMIRKLLRKMNDSKYAKID